MTRGQHLAEITRLRLQYDETKHRLSQLKHMLADLEDDMVPGQNESDKDRYSLNYQTVGDLVVDCYGLESKNTT